jgi:hypothetical protein
MRKPVSRPAVAAEKFHRLAVRYCRLVDSHRTRPIRSLLLALQRLIPDLYACGLRLPMSTAGQEPEPRRMTHEEWWRLFRSLGSRLGHRDHYREVFDAYDRKDREVLTGSLADDLADIHRDLTNGLRSWRSGDRRRAVWEWRFGVDYHWGEHATSAMRALYWLRQNHDFGPPGPMPGATRAIRPKRSRGRRISA